MKSQNSIQIAKTSRHVASSAGISPEKSGGGKPIHRLEPIERPAEEAIVDMFNIKFIK
jgi:hypothetical protein